jgi:hypothetical protein
MIGAPLAPAVGAGKLKGMERLWVPLAAALPLVGCGVAATGSGAGTAAETAVQQAAQAQAAQDQVRQQVDAAYRQAAEQRRAAEADGQ